MINWNDFYKHDEERFQEFLKNIKPLTKAEEDAAGSEAKAVEVMMRKAGAENQLTPDYYQRLLQEVFPMANAFNKMKAVGLGVLGTEGVTPSFNNWLQKGEWTGGMSDQDVNTAFNNFYDMVNRFQTNPDSVQEPNLKSYLGGLKLSGPEAYAPFHMAMLQRLFSPDIAQTMWKGIQPAYRTATKATPWNKVLGEIYGSRNPFPLNGDTLRLNGLNPVAAAIQSLVGSTNPGGPVNMPQTGINATQGTSANLNPLAQGVQNIGGAFNGLLSGLSGATPSNPNASFIRPSQPPVPAYNGPTEHRGWQLPQPMPGLEGVGYGQSPNYLDTSGFINPYDFGNWGSNYPYMPRQFRLY